MAATNFPFNLSNLNALKNTALNIPRFNLKNDGQYNIASGLSPSVGPFVMQGYASNPGDGGRAIIDGATNAIVLMSMSTSQIVYDLIFQNNGTAGSSNGITPGGNSVIARCVVNNVRGAGIGASSGGFVIIIECETYACNKSNTDGLGGFVSSGSTLLQSCIAHDNTGSNNDGFTTSSSVAGNATFINCISSTNGRNGFSVLTATSGNYYFLSCDAYNNAGDAIKFTNTTTNIVNAIFRNCNFVKNTGWGVNTLLTTGRMWGNMDNCGFGSGTQANGSGTTNNIDETVISGSVIYDAGITPWVDPANGDFRINFGEAEGAGRGAFTETSPGLSAPNTIGYPDIGAAQHADSQKGGTFGG